MILPGSRYFCWRLTATFQTNLLTWRVFRSRKKFKNKKTKKVQNILKIFLKFWNFQKNKIKRKKEQWSLLWKASGDLDGKTRLDENHVPQVDGCFSADGQKTRVNENPCPRGMYPAGLQEGRASGDLDGKF
jgi:hypothetical protein